MVAWLRQEASLRTRLMFGFTSVSILAGAGLIPLAQLRFGLDDATSAAGADLSWALDWGAAAVAGSFLLGCLWAATTAAPVDRALLCLEEVAAGRLDGAAAQSDGAGLVGRLGRATEKLRGLAREHLRGGGELADCRAELAAEQDRHAQTRSAWQTQERQVIETLSACLAKLRAGDLAARLTAALPPEYGALREAFNEVFAQLQQALTTVAERVGTLLAGAGEMSATAAEMARRTEQQAVILRQTTTALNQITETVRRSSAVAEEANTVVSVARGDAEKSGAVMAQAVSAMTHIEQSAGQISQIIGVIDEIAFQTNLLALNAGVEAARAGEAGRGFAVVASEVRALAQRSAEAAKQIKTLITTSTQQVKSGVGLVGQAGEALHRIVTQVGTLDTLIAGMTASAKEQASGLVEVNAAVNQMDQATQQSAAMVQSSTASGAALAREASALADQVGGFRLGAAAPRRADGPMRGKSAAPAPPRGATGHSAPRQPAPKQPGPKQPAHAKTDPDDWSEF